MCLQSIERRLRPSFSRSGAFTQQAGTTHGRRRQGGAGEGQETESSEGAESRLRNVSPGRPFSLLVKVILGQLLSRKMLWRGKKDQGKRKLKEGESHARNVSPMTASISLFEVIVCYLLGLREG